MSTLKGRYQLNDVIKEVTEQNSPEKSKKKKKSKKKYQSTTKSRE
jgi:hypothetical protein